ncbi:MAG: ArsC family reductase [Oxalicibacterium faecigallinarum]|uniref:ArsC family reductase n=1 Tax=Oxalicibacterium faecigallinarum TaxID=573741 RepID=UPI0028088C72|nr:ArsC family reductase [Oxalicibacterium faecigallinarum]MDQ7970667.1 ArsC family reductase [Oxalicibacterium faecigallinarum]
MTITLYGIPNCDTVKKARTWLEDNGIDYTFHDFKKNGIDAALIKSWLKDVPRDTLINRKGTTWRKVSDEQKAAADQDAGAVALMLESPSVIKRPVLSGAGKISVGFSADAYQQIFKK